MKAFWLFVIALAAIGSCTALGKINQPNLGDCYEAQSTAAGWSCVYATQVDKIKADAVLKEQP